MTPHQHHIGQYVELLPQRKERMKAAKAANPSRWGTREVRNCTLVGPTILNPERKLAKQVEKSHWRLGTSL